MSGNTQLGFFFCANCGQVYKRDVPYSKMKDECPHCRFAEWIWEGNPQIVEAEEDYFDVEDEAEDGEEWFGDEDEGDESE